MWEKFCHKKIKGKINKKKVTAVRGIKKAVFSKKYFKKVQNHASQPPKIAVDLLIFFYLYPIRKSHPFKILCWVVTPCRVRAFTDINLSRQKLLIKPMLNISFLQTDVGNLHSGHIRVTGAHAAGSSVLNAARTVLLSWLCTWPH